MICWPAIQSLYQFRDMRAFLGSTACVVLLCFLCRSSSLFCGTWETPSLGLDESRPLQIPTATLFCGEQPLDRAALLPREQETNPFLLLLALQQTSPEPTDNDNSKFVQSSVSAQRQVKCAPSLNSKTFMLLSFTRSIQRLC